MITATGENMDSVPEPIMVVSAFHRKKSAVFYQVRNKSRKEITKYTKT